MKKFFHIFLKVLLSLILVMPILGATGIFPAPTQDMYNTAIAFEFIEVMMWTYIVWGISITFALALISLWIRREALAALLLLPISVNIIGFHAFMDGGLFTGGAIMGNVLLVLNLYFMWVNRAAYRPLLTNNKTK